MDATTFVSTELVLDLLMPGDAPVPVTARFGFRTEDPFAVTLNFLVEGGEWVTWTFARSLLEGGLNAPSGDGDVQLWPGERDHQSVLYLRTSSPHGSATFVLPLAGTTDFLTRTYSRVALGAEAGLLDLDAELLALLGGLDS
jgi:hypothetical protein